MAAPLQTTRWIKPLRLLFIALIMLGLEYSLERLLPRERIQSANENIVKAFENISPGQLLADARDAAVIGYSRQLFAAPASGSAFQENMLSEMKAKQRIRVTLREFAEHRTLTPREIEQMNSVHRAEDEMEGRVLAWKNHPDFYPRHEVAAFRALVCLPAAIACIVARAFWRGWVNLGVILLSLIVGAVIVAALAKDNSGCLPFFLIVPLTSVVAWSILLAIHGVTLLIGWISAPAIPVVGVVVTSVSGAYYKTWLHEWVERTVRRAF